MDWNYLEGRKFCVVFVKILDGSEPKSKVQMQCLRGRASVERGRVSLVTAAGGQFTIPGTAMARILPSDGSELLKDAEFYVIVRTDPNIDFRKFDPDHVIDEDEAD